MIPPPPSPLPSPPRPSADTHSLGSVDETFRVSPSLHIKWESNHLTLRVGHSRLSNIAVTLITLHLTPQITGVAGQGPSPGQGCL